MKYIAHKRFKGEAICGKVNIAAGTELNEYAGVIYLDKEAICCRASENAHQFFAINDDGCGQKRGKLTQAIQKALATTSNSDIDAYNDKWDKVWNDTTCQKYKRNDFVDYWLWNNDFFEATIEDLEYIAKLIGAKAK